MSVFLTVLAIIAGLIAVSSLVIIALTGLSILAVVTDTHEIVCEIEDDLSDLIDADDGDDGEGGGGDDAVQCECPACQDARGEATVQFLVMFPDADGVERLYAMPSLSIN